MAPEPAKQIKYYNTFLFEVLPPKYHTIHGHCQPAITEGRNFWYVYFTFGRTCTNHEVLLVLVNTVISTLRIKIINRCRTKSCCWSSLRLHYVQRINYDQTKEWSSMCLNFSLQKLLPIRQWLQPKVWPVRRFRRSGWPGRYRWKQRDGTALKKMN